MTYQLSIGSDTAYEQLVAELVFGDGSVVVVSQERARDRFEVSFYAPHCDTGELATIPYLVDLDEFNDAITEAKQRLRLLDEPRGS